MTHIVTKISLLLLLLLVLLYGTPATLVEASKHELAVTQEEPNPTPPPVIVPRPSPNPILDTSPTITRIEPSSAVKGAPHTAPREVIVTVYGTGLNASSPDGRLGTKIAIEEGFPEVMADQGPDGRYLEQDSSHIKFKLLIFPDAFEGPYRLTVLAPPPFHNFTTNPPLVFTVLPTPVPTITGLSPDVFPAGAEREATLSGTNLTGAKVFYAQSWGYAGDIVRRGESAIDAAATSGDVKVTVMPGGSDTALALRVNVAGTYRPPPGYPRPVLAVVTAYGMATKEITLQPVPRTIALNPNTGIQGSVVSVSVTRDNLEGETATATVSGSGVQVIWIFFPSNRQTGTLYLAIDDKAAPVPRTVTVTTPTGSATAQFIVQEDPAYNPGSTIRRIVGRVAAQPHITHDEGGVSRVTHEFTYDWDLNIEVIPEPGLGDDLLLHAGERGSLPECAASQWLVRAGQALQLFHKGNYDSELANGRGAIGTEIPWDKSAAVVVPRMNDRVRITGTACYDSIQGWNEIHPINDDGVEIVQENPNGWVFQWVNLQPHVTLPDTVFGSPFMSGFFTGAGVYKTAKKFLPAPPRPGPEYLLRFTERIVGDLGDQPNFTWGRDADRANPPHCACPARPGVDWDMGQCAVPLADEAASGVLVISDVKGERNAGKPGRFWAEYQLWWERGRPATRPICGGAGHKP